MGFVLEMFEGIGVLAIIFLLIQLYKGFLVPYLKYESLRLNTKIVRYRNKLKEEGLEVPEYEEPNVWDLFKRKKDEKCEGSEGSYAWDKECVNGEE